MINKDFLIILLLLVIPLILMIVCYRRYMDNYCRNDMMCIKNRLLNNLNILNGRLQEKKYELEHMQNQLYNDSLNNNDQNNNDTIEGFFGGFGSWFSNTPKNGLPVAPGTLGNENLNMLEKKISDKMKVSKTFPPKDDEDGDDGFKDADNADLLKTINPNMKIVKDNLKLNGVSRMGNNQLKQTNTNLNAINANTNINAKMPTIEKMETNNMPSVQGGQTNLKNALSTCQFFNDKCPSDYQPLGNFSISGTGSNTILACGNVDKVKPAHAIAIIKNNSIYEINVTDPGFGFNPSKPPKIMIESGKGTGATAEAVVDDNGYLKLIKVIHPGYNYTETPNVIIDAPFMNSSCHLCCKF